MHDNLLSKVDGITYTAPKTLAHSGFMVAVAVTVAAIIVLVALIIRIARKGKSGKPKE